MTIVITSTTSSPLPQFHITHLRGLKSSCDSLIVNVTSDIFDWNRCKLNVRDKVLQRVECLVRGFDKEELGVFYAELE